MYAIDLHAHTRFFHGRRWLGDRYDPVGLELLTWAAKARGLDAVATTNHDYYTAFDDDAGAPGVTVVPGIEITTTHGHVVVVGPNPPEEVEPESMTPEEAVELAHAWDCAAIIAHPYRNSTVRETDVEFDAIEVNGKHPRTQGWVERLAEQRGLPLVGGSDAHYPVEVGRAFTRVDVDELTPESLVAAIHDGRVEPYVYDGPFYRALQTAYRKIHEGKEQLTRPDWIESGSTPGVGTPPGEDD